MIDLNFNADGRECSIHKCNGFYLCGQDGGQGKTYLYRVLESMQFNNVYVLTYLRDKELMELSWQKAISSDWDLIYADRADMYMTRKKCSELYDKRGKCTIMVDLKNPLAYMDTLPASVNIILWERALKCF